MEFIDLKAQYLRYNVEIDREIAQVVDSHRFILGEKGRSLESSLASFLGISHAVGVGSGTDALILALMALGIGPGDEVITSPFTFIATAEAIALTGARPVFVDIDKNSFNIDPLLIEDSITKNTKAIMAVDIFGLPADYAAINSLAKDYGLTVIEDGAQSFGARHGKCRAPSFAHIGTTSFFPAKPLGCFGEGGMVFTDDSELATRLSQLRNHGQAAKYSHNLIGKNSRLDEIQAAVLLVKFRHFEEELALRQEKAAFYRSYLKDFGKFQDIPEATVSSYAQFSLLVPDRDTLARYLLDRSVPTAIHYPIPLHLQKSFSFLGNKRGDFPVTEEVCQSVISLPFAPFMSEKDQERVVSSIADYYR